MKSPSLRWEGFFFIMTLRILDILHDTTVDGPGFRTSIYLAGCRHACPGCHNPESWNPMGGHEVTIDYLLQEIVSDPFAHVTLSGGDPLLQIEAVTTLSRRIKSETDKTIWCYTGYTLSSEPSIDGTISWILTDRHGHRLQAPMLHPDGTMPEILSYLDVLVDGPFMQSLRDEDLLFRGSSNQRLIDIPKTLAQGKVVEWTRSL